MFLENNKTYKLIFALILHSIIWEVKAVILKFDLFYGNKYLSGVWP